MHHLQGVKRRGVEAVVVIGFTGFLIIPIRGGFQLAPMNQSSVYFSTNNFANQAAINPVWNVMYGMLDKTSKTKNPYLYLPANEAAKKVDSLYVSTGSVKLVLRTQKPNVIFVIWESFTEKAIQAIIDGNEVTPQFNQLKKEGIYFSQAYASGDRTDRGLAAVLSGYPALPQTSVIRTPNKSAKIESVSRLLNQKGYQTSFYYGGETEFANIKSYLLQSNFSSITDIHDFDKKDQNSKWGAHDGVVADRLLKDLSSTSQPFFTTWLTLSSHEPYETPTPAVFETSSDTRKFLNSIHYTDDVLGRFVAACKKQTWWQNTLMIIVADHGHPLPATDSEIDRFKIPVLWLGGAIKESGVVIDKVVSQLDIAATLGGQIGLPANRFPFSKNSFALTTKPWAFFAFNNGFGYIQPDGGFVFDNVGKSITYQTGKVSSQMQAAGKALQQQTFQDYLNK
ncbi:MAG: hypothetical protein JWP88_1819 [Flaviaesturariibacter sp.]|nr:hypothetical protein [Flaviaesturariibacter sp.]